MLLELTRAVCSNAVSHGGKSIARGVSLRSKPGMNRLDTSSKRDGLIRAVMGTMVLAVFALYVCSLGKQSLWFDEGLSVMFAGRSLSELMQTLIHQDIHPPLHYLLLHFWMPLVGSTEFAVRMPSAFAAVLLVPLSFALVREVWGCDSRATEQWAVAGIVGAAVQVVRVGVVL